MTWLQWIGLVLGGGLLALLALTALAIWLVRREFGAADLAKELADDARAAEMERPALPQIRARRQEGTRDG